MKPDQIKEAAEKTLELLFPDEYKYENSLMTFSQAKKAIEYALSLVENKWVSVSDRSAPMPDDEELLVLFDTGEVILYSQDNWPEAIVTHWRLANLPDNQ